MSLSKLQKLVMDREAWLAAVSGFTRSWTRPSDWTELILIWHAVQRKLQIKVSTLWFVEKHKCQIPSRKILLLSKWLKRVSFVILIIHPPQKCIQFCTSTNLGKGNAQITSLEKTLGGDYRQGGLACCSPRGHKVLDTTEWLNWDVFLEFSYFL